jgi:hypothetical protein
MSIANSTLSLSSLAPPAYHTGPGDRSDGAGPTTTTLRPASSGRGPAAESVPAPTRNHGSAQLAHDWQLGGAPLVVQSASSEPERMTCCAVGAATQLVGGGTRPLSSSGGPPPTSWLAAGSPDHRVQGLLPQPPAPATVSVLMPALGAHYRAAVGAPLRRAVLLPA